MQPRPRLARALAPAVRPRELALWAAVAVLLTAAYLVPLWIVPFPPLQDYPYHLVRIHVLSHFDDARFHYTSLFRHSLFPLPYILFDYLSLPFARLFSVPVAGKISLSIYIVLFVLSCFYFAALRELA